MKFRRSPRRTARIDVINLIDVVFVTLIFFMLATTFAREGKLQVTLPEASAQPPEQRPERIELLVSAGGSFAVAGRTSPMTGFRPSSPRCARHRAEIPTGHW